MSRELSAVVILNTESGTAREHDFDRLALLLRSLEAFLQAPIALTIVNFDTDHPIGATAGRMVTIDVLSPEDLIPGISASDARWRYRHDALVLAFAASRPTASHVLVLTADTLLVKPLHPDDLFDAGGGAIAHFGPGHFHAGERSRFLMGADRHPPKVMTGWPQVLSAAVCQGLGLRLGSWAALLRERNWFAGDLYTIELGELAETLHFDPAPAPFKDIPARHAEAGLAPPKTSLRHISRHAIRREPTATRLVGHVVHDALDWGRFTIGASPDGYFVVVKSEARVPIGQLKRSWRWHIGQDVSEEDALEEAS